MVLMFPFKWEGSPTKLEKISFFWTPIILHGPLQLEIDQSFFSIKILAEFSVSIFTSNLKAKECC